MTRTTGVMLLAALLGGAAAGTGAELKLLGSIAGQVRNTAGVGQMGATVYLLNRYERIVQRAMTSPDGRFRFASLAPDHYSIHVSLGSYVPATRNNVPVNAGMESFLSIQLANLFSSIELVYTAPGQTGLLSEDWKWTLRSSVATRPVLRLFPVSDPRWKTSSSSSSSTSTGHPSIFNSARGLVRVSAGDQGASSALGNEPDLGTAFAVATSLFGSDEIHFSGNVGYATSAGVPTAGFRTRYSRTDMGLGAPGVELTVRQAGIRQRAGQGLLFGPGNSQENPVLRTMSVKVGNKDRITDSMTLEYGAMLEAVIFLERMTLISPYARLTYDLGEVGQFEMGFSSGAPALDLIAASTDAGAHDALAGLAMFPRLSLAGGHARAQRNQTYEVGYRKVDGRRTYSAAAYQDFVRDAAVTMAAPAGFLSRADLLPDLASNSSVFNMGKYRTTGYAASVAQSFLDNWSAAVSLGAAGALAPGVAQLSANDAAEMRATMRPVRKPWASARLSGQFPRTGTRIVTSYMWTSSGTLGPAHAYITGRYQQQLGLNLQVRQPLPAINGMFGRLEMTADLRNLLAQGYVPVAASDGRTLYLIQFPRMVRGGVNFIF